MVVTVQGIFLGTKELKGQKGTFYVNTLEQRSFEGYPITVGVCTNKKNGYVKGKEVSVKVNIRPVVMKKSGRPGFSIWEQESEGKKNA